MMIKATNPINRHNRRMDLPEGITEHIYDDYYMEEHEPPGYQKYSDFDQHHNWKRKAEYINDYVRSVTIREIEYY